GDIWYLYRRRQAMATQRLSRLHQRILQWLAADHQRTQGFILSSYEELVKAFQRVYGGSECPVQTGGLSGEQERSRPYLADPVCASQCLWPVSLQPGGGTGTEGP